MEIKIAPTRMELLRLKKRIELAHRGHRLLQDKLEGLIKEFMPLVDDYVSARDELDRRLPRALAYTARAAAEVGEDRLRPALEQTGLRVEVEIGEQRRAGVAVPVSRPRSAARARSTACWPLRSFSTARCPSWSRSCRLY